MSFRPHALGTGTPCSRPARRIAARSLVMATAGRLVGAGGSLAMATGACLAAVGSLVTAAVGSLAMATAGSLVMASPTLAAELGPERITAEKLRSHTATLASDEFLGRGTGEQGTRLAEDYVAATLRDLGLQPIPGETDYFLEFPLFAVRADTARTSLRWRVRAGAGDLEQAAPSAPAERSDGGSATWATGLVGRDFRPFPFSDVGVASGEVVFAGYGISAPDLGYDDYEDLDVEGRIVLVLRHEPRETDPESPFDGEENTDHATFARKARVAEERGAVAMLLVTDPNNHESADDLRLQGRLRLNEEEARGEATGGGGQPPSNPGAGGDQPTEARGEGEDGTERPFLAVHVSRAVAESLLARSGATLSALQSRIDEDLAPESFALDGVEVSLSVELAPEPMRVEARNVAALLPGSDPEFADEWVVVGAHHDHLGAFHGPGDTIFNGADDNASGTSGVLLLAEAFAARTERPRRSILFTTFAAEEIGLLGSNAMVEQEQIPLEQVVFLLNMDMIGRNGDDPVQLTGDGFAPGLAEIIDRAFVEARGTRGPGEPGAFDIQLAGMSYMGNTDHAPFFARGVPFLTLFTGLHADYHQLGDHVEHLDFARMESIVRFAYGVVDRVANQPHLLPFLHDIAWLGVRVEAAAGPARGMQPEVESGNADSSGVARVVWVEAGSHAQRLGIQVGDVVLSVNDQPVTSSKQIGSRLDEIAPGSTSTLAFRRGEESFSVTVERAYAGYLGIQPSRLEDEDRAALALRSDEGVVAASVVPGGPADAGGLERGDVIVAIGGSPVDSGSLRRRLAQIGAGETVEVRILRNGEPRTLTITLGRRDS